MGLDMYLYVEEYISKWNYQAVEERAAENFLDLTVEVKNKLREHRVFDTVKRELGIEPCKDSPHMIVRICVAYWRKANAIHNWFIENCAENGVDDCYVSKEQFEQLRRDVTLAVAEEKKRIPAEGTIQPRSGFFSTDNFDDYLNELRETKEMLERLPDRDYIYRASW